MYVVFSSIVPIVFPKFVRSVSRFCVMKSGLQKMSPTPFGCVDFLNTKWIQLCAASCHQEVMIVHEQYDINGITI